MIKHKKIIHLTDLHLGYEDDDVSCTQTVNKVKLWIMANCAPRSDYVIVITGDLVNNANIKDLWDLSAEFIQQLSEPDASGQKYEILIVPGNHDYGSGSDANPKFVSIFKQRYFGNSSFEYPYIRIVGDGVTHEKVAFIGLDSNEDELNPLDHRLADGEIGGEQLGRLEDALRRNDVKQCPYRVIFLHHHPFESPIFKFGHWLKDSDKLRDVIKAAADEGVKVDALLFGHNHGGKPKHNKWGIPRVYDGGTTGGKRKPSFIRIIEDLSSPNVDVDKLEKFTSGG
ncbi:MAG: metallophosphoesterase [Proteobacteria bacterium]|nr:metallophosphoesterase [Pseudomonadota bacterium]